MGGSPHARTLAIEALPRTHRNRSDRRARPRRQAGFTLVEALVAFAALAMVLAVALPLLAGGLRGVDTADTRLAALALAESKLADATASWPVPFGVADGSDAAGQHWRLRVEPIAMAADAPPRLARYEVSVASPGGRMQDGVQLVTYRLLPPAPP
jgi:general secretion pathway protein I